VRWRVDDWEEREKKGEGEKEGGKVQQVNKGVSMIKTGVKKQTMIQKKNKNKNLPWSLVVRGNSRCRRERRLATVAGHSRYIVSVH